jgi:hypothetical protein
MVKENGIVKGRLSLEDFKLDKIEASNEIEKMLSMAAGGCHRTCNVDSKVDYIDWVDYTQE